MNFTHYCQLLFKANNWFAAIRFSFMPKMDNKHAGDHESEPFVSFFHQIQTSSSGSEFIGSLDALCWPFY